MCGIVCAIAVVPSESPYPADFELYIQNLELANSFRGPDYSGSHVLHLDLPSFSGLCIRLHFFSSVLSLRGDTLTKQPLISEDSNVLCFNGEIFAGLPFASYENDAQALFVELNRTKNSKDIYEVFQRIDGPFAAVYFQHATRTVYFCRDSLGRRSLLLSQPTTTCPFMVLCSSAPLAEHTLPLDEVPANKLWSVRLYDPWCGDSKVRPSTVSSKPDITLFESNALASFQINNSTSEPVLPSPHTITSLADESINVHPANGVLDGFLKRLDFSVKRRVTEFRRDPMVLESLHPAYFGVLFSGGIDSTMIAYLADRHAPTNEPIDLLNVAFENPRKLKLVNGSNNLPKRRRRGAHSTRDMEMIAPSYLVPDRISGLEELEELKKLCPNREWRFVEINVPYEDTAAELARIRQLMYPLSTNMDLSLASALYFASRGRGKVKDIDSNEYREYQSKARVLLNGLGSDELLGGYGRHRTAFLTASWKGLSEELQLDLDRISSRNLGRDDRVVSCHGKEARHPFLDLELVRFLAALPLDCKTDPRLPLGVGDKMILRMAARKVGMDIASSRKKRAMQFGTQSARMESGGAHKHGYSTIAD